ncbi:MAG: hypothetical protein EPO16_06125 [Dehalococcoidia bacterium]|nr:MAG: hypothetical protein EPO16_06125 [Dehalococcoidia bacterium]
MVTPSSFWSPTNLQFSRKLSTIVPGSRFFWSPSGKEVLVQTGTGVAVVDKADKQIWKMDGVKPLGWWSVTGIKGSAVLVTDGAKTRIVSTYNDQDLWTFAAPGAFPSPAGTAVLLQRGDGWLLWEPLTGMRPIPNVAASATAAWEPNGQRVAIEGPGSSGVVILNTADLTTSTLGVAGAVTGWGAGEIAVMREGAVRLATPDSRETKEIGNATFASFQPAAPKAERGTKPGPVKFVPVAKVQDGQGMSVAVAPNPDGQILYIADITGRVIADRGGTQATVLDIRNQVTVWDESGLLDVVLHPKFPQNRTAYVYYGVGGVTDKGGVGPRRDLIASFEIGPDGMSAVPNTFRVRYTIPTPQETPMSHNGGTLAFAPDGKLYLGLGDLGTYEAAADPSPQSVIGSFLVLDVDQPGEWTATKVAYGFRNPFRFSIDPVTTQVWIGDVGGFTREEIDILARNGNFGWPLREGEVCRDTLTDCNSPGLPPVHAWAPYSGGHDCGAGVIGGFVYRGSAIPDLKNWYLYSDLCSGDILAIDPAATVPESLTLGRVPGAPKWGAVVDLVPDAKGEPLVVGLPGGVFRITAGGN